MRLFKYAGPLGTGILESCRIKVTRPVDLNDPFEFSPAPGPPATTKFVRSCLQNLNWRSQFLQACKGSSYERPDFRIFDHLSGEQFAIAVHKMTESLNATAKSLILKHPEQISEDFGLLCFSKTHSSVEMWTHYGDNHRGIVVEFDSSKLANLRLWDVNYAKHRISIPLDDIWKFDDRKSFAEEVLTHKSDAWAYEQEVRSLVWIHDLEAVEIRGRAEPVIPFPCSAVTRVFLGYRCPESTEARVRTAISQGGLTHVALQKATLDESDYLLRFH